VPPEHAPEAANERCVAASRQTGGGGVSQTLLVPWQAPPARQTSVSVQALLSLQALPGENGYEHVPFATSHVPVAP
jgi:hypothetical protein